MSSEREAVERLTAWAERLEAEGRKNYGPPSVDAALANAGARQDASKAADLRLILTDYARLQSESAKDGEELRRLREAKWSDLSDADLGRCFKDFACKVEETSAKDWSGDAEMRLGLMQIGINQAIKMAAESNAETFTYKATAFHSEGIQHGDWEVTVARLSARKATPPAGSTQIGEG